MNDRLPPVMRYHGAKYRMADWILSYFPPHQCYVEPFGGSAAVLMRKPQSYAEVYNDLDDDVANVFECLRDPALSRLLINEIAHMPFSRTVFLKSNETSSTLPRHKRAAKCLARAHMGFSSASATAPNKGFRSNSQRPGKLPSHIWAEYPAAITKFMERLSGVILENQPAIDVIESHDTTETLFYVDPPYLEETRADRCMGAYRFEMGEDDHQELLETLNSVHGMVILSGYESDLYQATLSQWTCVKKRVAASSQKGTVTRTECLWLNTAAASHQAQSAFDFGGQLCS